MRPVVEPGAGRSPRRSACSSVTGAVVIKVLVIIVVDLQDRRVDAGAEALDLGQREHPIGAGLLVAAEPGLVAARPRHLVRAAQPARGGAANLQVKAPDRRHVEHEVERRDLVDADRGHVEPRRHHVHRHPRHPGAAGLPPHLPLRQIEQRDHRARLAALRISFQRPLDVAFALLVEGEARRLGRRVGRRIDADLGGGERGRPGRDVVAVDHRYLSISPNTTSNDPMMATASANMCRRAM